MSDNTTQSAQKKWLIVVLIYADFTTTTPEDIQIEGDIKLGLDSMFKDIVTTPIDPQRTRAYVIMSSTVFAPDGKGVKVPHTQLLQYEIVNECKSPVNEVRKFEPQKVNVGASAVHEVHSLTNILREIKVYDDEEVLLITWDHGAAFGIFREGPIQKVEPFELNLQNFPYLRSFLDLYNVTSTLPKIASAYTKECSIKIGSRLYNMKDQKVMALHRNELNRLVAENYIQVNVEGFKNTGFDVQPDRAAIVINPEDAVSTQKPEILSNGDLAEAIKDWLNYKEQNGGERQAGVLLMMNCFMMNMHTMYSMRNIVQCLVATQGAMSNPGYNYKCIIRYINDGNNDLSPKSVAKQCVDSSCNNVAKKRAFRMGLRPDDTIDTWSIFAIDLQAQNTKENKKWFDYQLEVLLDTLNCIATLYNDDTRADLTNSMRRLCYYSRSVMYDFGGNKGMIDILNWVDALTNIDQCFSPKLLINCIDLQKKIAALDTAIYNDGYPPTVIAKNTTKYFYNLHANQCIMPAPNGYSFFFPVKDDFTPELLDYVASDQLLNIDPIKTMWMAFVKAMCSQQ